MVESLVHTHAGQPTKYKPEYCQRIIEFFSVPPYREVQVSHRDKKGEEFFTTEERMNDPPYFSQFARSIGVTEETLYTWAERHSEFSEAFKMAHKLQEEFISLIGLKGLSNPACTIFFLKNKHGWKDRDATPQQLVVLIPEMMGQVKRLFSLEDRKKLLEDLKQIEYAPHSTEASGVAAGSGV